MFIVALFIIAKRGNNPNIHQLGEQINKMWYILTMEHYLAIKRNEVHILAATCMNLEDTMLNERG